MIWLAVIASCSLVDREQRPSLDLPVACSIGQTCFVQQYMDHDPGAGARDFRCGARTYDGHSGTDIRLKNRRAMREGVDVLAPAPATVKAVRDGVRDAESGPAGKECGNGVVLDHGQGWETQLCHLSMGSIVVSAGERVKRGQRLGQIGLSGKTEFPHVHLAVRLRGESIDPFAFPPGDCDAAGALWSEGTAAALRYRSPDLLDWGLAGGPVELADVESGTVVPPSPTSEAVVGWVRVMGLQTGDVPVVSLVGPDGSEMATNEGAPVERPKATWLSWVGKRNRGTLSPGVWRVRYRVLRDGGVVLDGEREVEMPD